MDLKFDHIIHYIDQLEQFKFPGNLITLHSGGKHNKFGTFNKLSYINGNYIEFLDVEDQEKLQKLAKTEEGRVSFATKIAQDHFKQGFKTICLRTNNIDAIKQTLEERNIEVIGPVNMERETKKGEKITWRLLYIADPSYMVKPPFFIQWDQGEANRYAQLEPLYQTQFSIEMIIVTTSQREKTVQNWQNWFDMQVVNETDKYTDLILKEDQMYFRIEDGKESGYHTVVFKDAEATSPYSIYIRGAKYRFEPNN
ncbi:MULTISPECIES: VOC family protein [Staphylococcus]|uniref:VOC family protein n=1 Tax=Staphylococcus TaxID=1279 RepID=UPI00048C09BE|nr:MULTISPECIES: VOC family protein [Staphylococcus]MBL3399355.1 VOC family protein [Staphylococcus pasteuri]RFD66516.1 sulfurtransferase [Staphylococcus pasteuri]